MKISELSLITYRPDSFLYNVADFILILGVVTYANKSLEVGSVLTLVGASILLHYLYVPVYCFNDYIDLNNKKRKNIEDNYYNHRLIYRLEGKRTIVLLICMIIEIIILVSLYYYSKSIFIYSIVYSLGLGLISLVRSLPYLDSYRVFTFNFMRYIKYGLGIIIYTNVSEYNYGLNSILIAGVFAIFPLTIISTIDYAVKENSEKSTILKVILINVSIATIMIFVLISTTDVNLYAIIIQASFAVILFVTSKVSSKLSSLYTRDKDEYITHIVGSSLTIVIHLQMLLMISLV